jgi:hypothetical protein
MYVASVSSGYCKNRFGCCIYMHVANVCFRCFIRMLQVFRLDVAYACNDFQVFFRCFTSISTYVRSVLAVSDICCVSSEYCKNGSGIAYSLRIGFKSRLGQGHDLQNTTLTSCFYKKYL